VNPDSSRGDQKDLGDQDHQPAGKNDTVNDEKRRQVQLGEPGIEVEGSGEAGEDESSGKKSDEEIEAAVAKARGQRCIRCRAVGHVGLPSWFEVRAV